MPENSNIQLDAESANGELCTKQDLENNLKTIRLNFLTGQFSIDVLTNRLNVVGDVKEYVRSLKGIDIRQQEIVFVNRQLENYENLLELHNDHQHQSGNQYTESLTLNLVIKTGRKIQLNFTESFMDFDTLEMHENQTILDLKKMISRLTSARLRLIDVSTPSLFQHGRVISNALLLKEDLVLQVTVKILIEIERKGGIEKMEKRLTKDEWVDGKIKDLIKLQEHEFNEHRLILDEEYIENEGLELETPLNDVGERKIRFIVKNVSRKSDNCVVL
uniref:Ubiquitin-like domain-containing protein n=1 Tax=Clytia hemisphaerica TaxID=252671 RepID=A0A7M5V0J0_9CNID|eukprot:TCONS_00050149-protein